MNRFPTPKRFLDSEIPVVGMLARPVSLLHEIVDVAGGCASVDAVALRRDLDDGTARAERAAAADPS